MDDDAKARAAARANWPIRRFRFEDDPFERITHDPAVMGGRPCIRGMRITVGTIVGSLAEGHGVEEILSAYPYLEREDIHAALAYAAWMVDIVDTGSA